MDGQENLQCISKAVNPSKRGEEARENKEILFKVIITWRRYSAIIQQSPTPMLHSRYSTHYKEAASL